MTQYSYPAISISAVTGKDKIFEGEMIEFELTATPPTTSSFIMSINLEETGNFFHSSVDRTKKTELSLPSGISTTNKHTVMYQTKDDNGMFEEDSTVTLTINDGGLYDLGGNPSATVTVFDKSTPTGISVLAISDATDEDRDNETDVMFQIKAHKDTDASTARVINVSVDDGDADFLKMESRDVETVTIPLNEYWVDLTATILGDDVFEIPGEIQVTIEEPDSDSATYTVASSNSSASVAVNDDDFPISESANAVAIKAIKSSVSEAKDNGTNGVAPFVIIPNISQSNSRTIMVRVDDGTDDFLPDNTYDNNVPVMIPADAKHVRFDVTLDNDTEVESDGTVTATVQMGSGYIPASAPNNTASITVTSEDTVALPVITIRSDATTSGVTEGFSFDFEVESDKNITGSSLEISFTPSFTGGGTNPNATITGTTVSIPVGEDSASGTVTMDAGFNIGSSDNVNIVITIAPDTTNYTVGSPGSITVEVKDNDAPSASEPKVSISAPNYAAEGDTITFTVTALPAPTNNTAVNVMFTVTGDFIATSETELTKPANITGDATTGTVTFATKADSPNGVDGLITATILDGANYVRSDTSSENETSVVILDQLPVISLSAPDAVDETDANSTFDLTLTIETASFVPLTGRPLVIDGLTIANTSDPLFQNYYQSHTSPIQFTDANNASNRDITIPVTILGDDAYNNWGEISIALADSTSKQYTADSNNNSATVSIREDESADVSIAIEAPTNVVEGENLVVKLVATNSGSNAVNNLMVDFQAADVTGMYLNYTNAKVSINATTGSPPAEVEVTIPTREVQNSSEGSISLVVVRDNRYEPASTTPVNVTVKAKEDIVLPEISLSGVPDSVTQGHSFTFTVSASGTLEATGLPIIIQFDDNSKGVISRIQPGTYRADGNSELTIPQGGSQVVTVSTTNPSEIGNQDLSITLWAPASGATYTIATGAAGSDTLASKDNTASTATQPRLSIANIIDPVRANQRADADFTITATPDPTETFTIAYNVSEPGDFVTDGNFTRDNVSFTEGTATLSIATSDTDNADNDNTTLTVTLLDGATYSLADNPGHIATATITDDEPLPVVSITAPEYALEGGTFTFTVSAEPAPSGSESYTVSYTVGNGDSNTYYTSHTPNSVTLDTTTPAPTVTVTVAENVATSTDGRIDITITGGGTNYDAASDMATGVTIQDKELTS